MNCYCCQGETKRFGKFQNKNRIVQRYRCVRCGKTSSESQPLDGAVRIEHDKVVQIVKLLSEGLGIRAISRFTGCHTHTVLNVLDMVGDKCRRLLHDKFTNITPKGPLQIDELWSRVGIRQSRTHVADELRGDFYTFLAIDSVSKLILSHHTGKRDVEATETFCKDLASRVDGRVQITTDGFSAYPNAIRRNFFGRTDYAMMQKHYAATSPQKESSRRYSPAPFVGVDIRIKIGNPDRTKISTSYVERTNLTVRHFNKRFTRLGIGWSKKLENHKSALVIFVAVYNLVKIHRTTGTTPAHAAGLTDKAWTIEELIKAATKY